MGGTLKRMVFQPPLQPTYDAENADLVWLRTQRHERIPAFFIDRNADLTVLFSHGNAEDIGMVVEYFRDVAALWRCNVFVYEYVGYGRSTGKPSERGVYDAAEAAYLYLTRDLKIPPGSLVAYGRSLGTGACCHLGSRFPLGGMILQSALASVHRVGLHVRFSLPGDMFCNIDKIHKIPAPVFIIHGTQDEVVPVRHGVQLYKKCKRKVAPYWVTGGGHNNLELLARREFYSNVARFLHFVRAERAFDEDVIASTTTNYEEVLGEEDIPRTSVAPVATTTTASRVNREKRRVRRGGGSKGADAATIAPPV